MRADTPLAMKKALSNFFGQDSENELTSSPCSIISVNDDMFHGDADAYFRIGLEALNFIMSEKNALAINHPSCKILVLPSGHGRETRFIKAHYPSARVIACDLDLDAIDFCEKVLNCETLVSHEDFSLVNLPSDCNVIWVGSLVTHISSIRAELLISRLWESLTPGGILVFSSHGNYVADVFKLGPNYGLDAQTSENLMSEFNESGYGYGNYPDQDNYGISVISQDWYVDLIQRLKLDCKLSFSEQEWDRHHDVIRITRN